MEKRREAEREIGELGGERWSARGSGERVGRVESEGGVSGVGKRGGRRGE